MIWRDMSWAVYQLHVINIKCNTFLSDVVGCKFKIDILVIVTTRSNRKLICLCEILYLQKVTYLKFQKLYSEQDLGGKYKLMITLFLLIISFLFFFVFLYFFFFPFLPLTHYFVCFYRISQDCKPKWDRKIIGIV